MTRRAYSTSLSGKLVLGTLAFLVALDFLWGFEREFSGPFVAALFYASVLLLCWRKRHFQAAVVAGLFGLGIHLYELAIRGLQGLEGVERGVFFANVALPVLLVWFGTRAVKEVKQDGSV